MRATKVETPNRYQRLLALHELVEDLRERTKLRYLGDCRCGECQLVHQDDLRKAIAAIEILIDAVERYP